MSRSEPVEQERIYWKKQIESWQESGFSQIEYCRQHDLKRHQLACWKKADAENCIRDILYTGQMRCRN